MHLNPAYLFFALLPPVAYAAPTTAGSSNLSSRGQLLVLPAKVHVKIFGDPHFTYLPFNELHRERLQPRLKSIFEYWIRNTKMIKLDKEGKKITIDIPLEPLDIVIEDGSITVLDKLEFWGPGVKEIPGLQGCESQEDRCFANVFPEVVYFRRGGVDLYYVHRNATGYGEGLEKHNCE
ncbi:hypothetical protein GGU11DRAFT_781729 [Lentinula aff. detonsa]|uniref:Uncharacterized protein n=1 Tax=Lentinula aff. detonsa TaxID=2804958 RepID=A0AA38KMP9_9AGAR|nr:hypothetical protein GGU10DRAFT_363497 [Lentinula aff. detonsa]KAJ3798246.1 hypothetical protein GGU11DRAFT_781729 [Lentinula aff. detonsa]